MSERSYDNTGASEGSQYKYLKIELTGAAPDRKCEIRIGSKDGPRATTFTGYLQRILAPAWREKHDRINAHYEYPIILEAKDAADGQVKEFHLGLHSHWSSPICSDIANQLAGALQDPAWDGKVRINVYAKMNRSMSDQLMRACLYDGNTGEKLPYKFPWVGTKEDGEFQGVPKPTKNPAGELDYTTVSDFWHNEFVLLAKHYNQDTTNSVPHAGVPLGSATTQQTNTATIPDRMEKYVRDMTTKLSITPSPASEKQYSDLVKKTFELSAKQNPTQDDLETAAHRLYRLGILSKFLDGTKEQFFDNTGTLIALAPVPEDDLPF